MKKEILIIIHEYTLFIQTMIIIIVLITHN